MEMKKKQTNIVLRCNGEEDKSCERATVTEFMVTR